MNAFHPIVLSMALFPLSGVIQAATLTQTFEPSEDTSDWGSPGFSNGSIVDTFLSPAFGGEKAGSGASPTQNFSRSFADNTVGIAMDQPYSISLYLQIDSFDTSVTGGEFQVLDGAFGAHTGGLRVIPQTVEGNTTFIWQAQVGSGWQDLGISLTLENPYRLELTIDPINYLYSATVAFSDADGNTSGPASISNVAFSPSIISNHENGTLLFYINAGGSGISARVDNIVIEGIPEPSLTLLAAGSTLLLSVRRRR